MIIRKYKVWIQIYFTVQLICLCADFLIIKILKKIYFIL